MTALADGFAGNRLTAFYRGRTVLVTGSTGLLGRWVLALLAAAGAEGVGLTRGRRPGGPGVTADVTDLTRVRAAVAAVRPSVVLHLAAQSQARAGEPAETWAVNVLGTVNVLEAAADAGVAGCVVAGSSRDPARAASDGAVRDPYNASKLAVEHAVLDYRQRALAAGPARGVALARPAVLLGGGDPNAARLVPGLLAALQRGEQPMLRTPTQYRPWQHAVEAAAGLLWLAATLVADPAGTASAYNFGPPAQAAAVPAGRLAEMLAAAWSSTPAPPPTIGADEGFGLDDTAARADLGWHACWSLDRALFATAEWHRAGPSAAGVVTAAQVTRYSADAAAAGVRWAQPCRTPQS